jgi:hypothetical protein
MDELLKLAKISGLKGQSETKLSLQEETFARLIIQHCGQYTDPNTRKIMFRYLGIEE